MRVITVLILVIVSTEREEVKEATEATRKVTAELKPQGFSWARDNASTESN
jgi:hypothetical protein